MKRGRKFLLLFPFWLILGLSGCTRMIATMHQVPYDVQVRDKAQELLDRMLEKNQIPETFKGIGNIKITRDHQIEKGRLAWMASWPDMLRMELLTPYGQPGASFSTDGEHIYFFLHADKQFYKKTLSESSLKPFISIPVHPREIISLLCGRPPNLEYSFISMIESSLDSEPFILIQKKWWKGYQKIYPDKNREHIRAVEVYDGSGELRYRVNFSEITEISNIRVPFLLVISDGQGITMELVVSRYWPHAEIEASSFVLRPPEG